MIARILNRRAARALLLFAGSLLALSPLAASAQATTTQLALTGAAVRAYGERTLLRGTVTFPSLSCPAAPADAPGGQVSIRLDGVHQYFSPLVIPATCSGDRVQGTFVVDNDILPVGDLAFSAEYTGDGRNLGSNSAPLTVTVNPQFSGTAAPTLGIVKVGITGDTGNPAERWDCRLSVASMSGAGGIPSPPPVSIEFVNGFFNYQFDTCARVSASSSPPPLALRQRILLKAPATLPPGASVWTYGPKQSGAFPEWYQLTARVFGPYAEVFIEDGAAGDDTVLGDGFIRGFLVLAMPSTNHVKFDVEGLWWAGPQENGWGMSVARTRDTLFNTFFVYDEAGRGQWIVMPGGIWNATYTVYTGDLYIPTGTWLGNYDASRLRVGDAVGSATITFTADDAASLSYTVRGASGTKAMRKQIFGVPPPVVEKLAGLWWGGQAQNGWGLSIHQQSGTLFNVWYTYDTAGNAVWYVMPGGAWIRPRVYSGPLYRTRGSPWAGRVYDPSRLVVEPVGTMTLAFDTESNGYMTYVLDGVDQTRAITRQPF